MKSELKAIIEALDPKVLGVGRISISSFRKLGIGEGNINYVFRIEGKKFVCRVNIDKGIPDKSKEEFSSLKKVEGMGIAPKPYYYHPKDKRFPYGFIIIGFTKGKPFRMKKRSYSEKQIKCLARILARLHSKKCSGMPKKNYSFEYFISEAEEYNRAINKHDSSLRKELEEILGRIKDFLPKKEEHEFSLVHGDICPQNIVEKDGRLKLIDWESLQYSDPAKDIANVMVDLGLKDKNLGLFMGGYHKLRKDPKLLERAKVYAVLLRYLNFLWEIERSIDILSKKMHREYLKKTSAESHIREAKMQLRKLGRHIDTPEIDVDLLFNNKLRGKM